MRVRGRELRGGGESSISFGSDVGTKSGEGSIFAVPGIGRKEGKRKEGNNRSELSVDYI